MGPGDLEVAGVVVEAEVEDVRLPTLVGLLADGWNEGVVFADQQGMEAKFVRQRRGGTCSWIARGISYM